MSIFEAIQSIDLQHVIDKMTLYATSRLRSVNVKSFNGKEPVDFVGEVLLKVLDNQRDWSKAQCSFEDFLFGCLRSDISNFFATKQINATDQLPYDIEFLEEESVSEQKILVQQLLIEAGADDEEQIVFELWMDGIIKSNEIATELGISPNEVYKINRRLERRLLKIKTQVKNIL
jgi:DNA-directed RNA polymerase specialized sigma24 family protein